MAVLFWIRPRVFRSQEWTTAVATDDQLSHTIVGGARGGGESQRPVEEPRKRE